MRSAINRGLPDLKQANKFANFINKTSSRTLALLIFSGALTAWSSFKLLTPPFIRPMTMSCPPHTPLIGGFESIDPAQTYILKANQISLMLMVLVVGIGLIFTLSLLKKRSKTYKIGVSIAVFTLWLLSFGIILTNSHFCG